MKTRTRFIVITVILVLIGASLITYRTLSSRDATERIITIGAILPLTGDLSSYGVDTRKALELATEQQNANGGIAGAKLALVIEDSHGAAAQAVAAFNKLVDVDGAVACLGPITSPEVLSLAPLSTTKRTPVISPSATSVEITQAGDYVFRTINVDDVETEAFAPYLHRELGIDTVGILANQAAGTMSYANSFEKFFTTLGGKVPIKEVLPQGSSDYRSSIAKVLAEQVPAIYIAGVSHEIGEAVRQIRTFDPEVRLLSYQSAEDRRVVDIAGDSVNGLVFSSTTLPEEALGAPHATFIQAFSARFGNSPGIFAAEIYDGFNIVAEALRRCIPDETELLTCLEETSGYPGASGEITFDENGDVHKPIAFYRYESSAPTFIRLGTGDSD